MGSAMYDHMCFADDDIIVDRGMSLIKLIRLITLATADSGYLNFMGNEFGHPEWIDFPRDGNAWSYHYARRQWHLVDDSSLKYHLLGQFDRDLLNLIKQYKVLENPETHLLYEHTDDKVIAFKRANLLFVLNFHPTRSHADYRFEAPSGKYQILMDSDATLYGGHGRLDPKQFHFTCMDKSEKPPRHLLSLYLPTRTGIVLKSIRRVQ
jgi:1,4-alpha-glucan branching enzyme